VELLRVGEEKRNSGLPIYSRGGEWWCQGYGLALGEELRGKVVGLMKTEGVPK